jgi:hypothetical protein
VIVLLIDLMIHCWDRVGRAQQATGLSAYPPYLGDGEGKSLLEGWRVLRRDDGKRLMGKDRERPMKVGMQTGIPSVPVSQPCKS